MPKVTISFNLPDENSEYKLCNRAGELASIVYEFTQLCREKTEYADEKAAKEGWEDVRVAWWAILNDSQYDPYTD